MIMRTLLAYIPSFSRNLHTEVENRFQDVSVYAKHRLRLRKSTTFPLGTSSIEENTARGVSDVLHDLWARKCECSLGGSIDCLF